MLKKLDSDSKYLLCVCYLSYLGKKEKGISEYYSRRTALPVVVHQTFMPEWSLDDLDDSYYELSRAGFLVTLYDGNVIRKSKLTNSAIDFMGNRFKNGYKEIMNFMAGLKKMIFCTEYD